LQNQLHKEKINKMAPELLAKDQVSP